MGVPSEHRNDISVSHLTLAFHWRLGSFKRGHDWECCITQSDYEDQKETEILTDGLFFCGSNFKIGFFCLFVFIQIQSCGKEILMANNNREFICIRLI